MQIRQSVIFFRQLRSRGSFSRLHTMSRDDMPKDGRNTCMPAMHAILKSGVIKIRSVEQK